MRAVSESTEPGEPVASDGAGRALLIDGASPGRRDEPAQRSTAQRVLLFSARYGTLMFLALLIVLFTVLCQVRLGDQRFLTGANLSLVLRSPPCSRFAGGLTVPSS